MVCVLTMLFKSVIDSPYALSAKDGRSTSSVLNIIFTSAFPKEAVSSRPDIVQGRVVRKPVNVNPGLNVS